jgi:hypothetical protein
MMYDAEGRVECERCQEMLSGSGGGLSRKPGTNASCAAPELYGDRSFRPASEMITIHMVTSAVLIAIVACVASLSFIKGSL